MNLTKKRRHVMNDADIWEQRTANCPNVLQLRKEAREFLAAHPLPPEFFNRRPAHAAETLEAAAAGGPERN